MDLETRMRVVSENAYNRLLSNLWWQRVAITRPSQTRKERIVWLLQTALIRYTSRTGGDLDFGELGATSYEYENLAAGAGLKLNRFDLEDQDANGIDAASDWARQMGAYAAYWPQKSIAEAIREGTGTTGRFGAAYDNLAFFSASHLLDPLDSSKGTYSNLIAAKPIDETNAPTIEAAFANLNSAISSVRNIKMPNGVDPRFLRVNGLLVPPALAMRANLLTNAQFISAASGAGSAGGGSLDVKAVVNYWNIGQPVVCDELSAAQGGSDTSYYLSVEAMGDEEIGALTYVDREPFSIVYNTGMTDAELQRANDLQWTTRGRNTVAYGHPYRLVKVNAT
jgi:phage major head subunit gpT-like protein